MFSTVSRGVVVVMIAWQFHLQLTMQLVPITTDVVSSNPDQGEVAFSAGIPVSSTNKTNCRDITKILLKVALNTIKQTNNKQLQ